MVHVMALRKPDLKPSSPVPLYVQVADWVQASVARGDLAPGDKLPAGRELAERWEVGYNTLMHAWDVLRERGVVVTTHGKGTFVTEQPPAHPR
jgi:GntR family transcriptional regulator